MNARKIISFFLSLILLIQVLPLQQIAAWLFKNQVTEELAHNVNPVKAKPGMDEVHSPFSPGEYSVHTQSFSSGCRCRLHPDEALFSRHADDILTPPPNC